MGLTAAPLLAELSHQIPTFIFGISFLVCACLCVYMHAHVHGTWVKVRIQRSRVHSLFLSCGSGDEIQVRTNKSLTWWATLPVLDFVVCSDFWYRCSCNQDWPRTLDPSAPTFQELGLHLAEFAFRISLCLKKLASCLRGFCFFLFSFLFSLFLSWIFKTGLLYVALAVLELSL